MAARALTWRPERPGALRGAVAFRSSGQKKADCATVLSGRSCRTAAAASQKGDAPAGRS